MTLNISDNLALPSNKLSRRQRLARYGAEVRYAIDLIRNRFDTIFAESHKPGHKMRLFYGSSLLEQSRIALQIQMMSHHFSQFTMASGRLAEWDAMDDDKRRHCKLLNTYDFETHESEINDLLEILTVLMQGSAFTSTAKGKHVPVMRHSKLTETELTQAIEVVTIKYGSKARAVPD